MDVIKIIIICSAVHSTHQTSNNLGQTLNLASIPLEEEMSCDEKAIVVRWNGVIKKCYGTIYEDRVCSKWCMDAWIHNYYTLAFWNSAVKSWMNSKCPLYNGEKNAAKYFTGHSQEKELVLTKNSNENEKNVVPISPLETESPDLQNLYSSVWCYSSPESSLRCHFQNLHYNVLLKEFAFVYSPDSVIYGIKNIEDLQDHLYMSSVMGHTAFQVHVSVVPFTSFITKYKSKIIYGKSLFMARFKPDNLLHVFHDDLLPIYFTLQELCMNKRSCFENLRIIITDENERGIYWDLLQLLSKKIILISELSSSNKYTWYCFESAYIGLNMISVWYQYGFGKPQGPQIKRTFSGHLLRQFTGFMKKKLNVPLFSNDTLVGVLISRKLNRKIVNENEVSAVIQDHLAMLSSQKNSEVKVLSLEENGVPTVINALSQARVAVGVHGAALILGMFLAPGSLLIEIWPLGISPSAATVYRTMCELEGFGVLYLPWMNKDPENTVFHPEYPKFYGGLSHLSFNKQEDIIRGISENKIEDLECCDNSNWLFRIYQDTKVHITENCHKCKSVSFTSVLKEGLKLTEEYLVNNEAKAKNKMHLQMYPSRVQEAYCFVIRDISHTKLFMEWKDPWNTDDINCLDIFFEVILQVDGESTVERKVLRNRNLFEEIKSEAENVNIWITCFCNGIQGAVQHVKCLPI